MILETYQKNRSVATTPFPPGRLGIETMNPPLISGSRLKTLGSREYALFVRFGLEIESASTIFRLVQTKTGKFDQNLYNIGKPRILALRRARVVKLVYTLVLGTSAVRRKGSSPFSRTVHSIMPKWRNW